MAGWLADAGYTHRYGSDIARDGAVPERTIDGATLDPLSEFNELQTLVRGVLAPVYLLDYRPPRASNRVRYSPSCACW